MVFYCVRSFFIAFLNCASVLLLSICQHKVKHIRDPRMLFALRRKKDMFSFFLLCRFECARQRQTSDKWRYSFQLFSLVSLLCALFARTYILFYSFIFLFYTWSFFAPSFKKHLFGTHSKRNQALVVDWNKNRNGMWNYVVVCIFVLASKLRFECVQSDKQWMIIVSRYGTQGKTH